MIHNLFKNKTFIFLIIFSSFLIILGFLPNNTLNAQSNRQETYKQLNLFGDVFQRVQEQYVEEVTDKELIESAISGMLQSLDPHSSYLSVESYEDMQVKTKGTFGGLGIEITMEDGFVKVVSPIDDTPAALAGMQSGDLIIAVNGESLRGLSINEAVSQLRGPIGSKIKITVVRNEEEPFELEIKRDIIKITSVKHNVINNVGYIRLTTFSETTTEGLEIAVEKIQKEIGDNFLGLILDLRNNPGGLLNQSISVSDAFLNQGEIVSTKGRKKDDASRVFAKKGDIINGKPLVVLINSGSASASEIVAGALKDHSRAIIIGTRSFGKGSVQSIIPLAGNGAMRLTTARYYTPSGISIQAKGIQPDIIVEAGITEANKDKKKNRREENLRGALDNKNKKSKDENPEPKIKLTVTEKLIQDNQVSRAIDLIRGISLFSNKINNISKNSLSSKK
ncbi:S41 family peptidase [Alphaproteobacteria bacterium]|jgi:carboxyl-terminal processing protease|nr:S41 family peptidase [Alphaproteobacteria bacterium]|tara:strand:+ start:312 stop:1661 length:1350 start_codon:yes stop_codon:yes gene_type:complete